MKRLKSITFDLGIVISIAKNLREYRIIVEKSTVPVNTAEWIRETIHNYAKSQVDFDVASNPEFLRESSAVYDFLNPDRIVLGVESQRAEKSLKNLYKSFTCPIFTTDLKTVEIIKHASNSFLATRISFINMISVKQLVQMSQKYLRVWGSILESGKTI